MLFFQSLTMLCLEFCECEKREKGRKKDLFVEDETMLRLQMTDDAISLIF